MLLLERIRTEVDESLNQYDKCSAEQQTILRVLACIYQELNQTTLNRILERLNTMGVFSDPSVAPKLDAQSKNLFIARGLIKVSKSNFKLTPNLSHILMVKTKTLGELESVLEHIQVELPMSGRFDPDLRSPMQKARYIRECLYLDKFDVLAELLKRNEKERMMRLDEQAVVADALFYPYQSAFVAQLPSSIIAQAFCSMLERTKQQGEDNIELLMAMEHLCRQKGKDSDVIALLLCEQYLRRCELEKAEKLLSGRKPSIDVMSLSGWLAFAKGQFEAAITEFENVLALKAKASRLKRHYLEGSYGIIFCLALLKSGYESDSNRLNQLLTMVTHLDKDNLGSNSDKQGFLALAEQARIFIGQSRDTWFIDINQRYFEESEGLQLGILLSSLCFIWQGQQVPGEYYDKLVEYFDNAVAAKQYWLAHPLARLLFESQKAHDEATRFLRSYKLHAVDWVNLIKPKERWEQVLDQLVALQAQPEQAQQSDVRIAWWVYRNSFPHKVEAKEQKRTKNGWTKGRVVALKRFKEELDTFDCLSMQDLKIIDQIQSQTKEHYHSYNTFESYSLSGYDALKGCIGHPHVFFADKPQQAIDIVDSEPELTITEGKSGYRLFMPGLSDDQDDMAYGYSLIEQGSNRFGLVRFNQKHRLIGDIIGHQGLSIPKKAKDRVLQSVKSVAPFLNIHSDIAGLSELDMVGERVEPDTTFYINIQPSGNGLQMECLVQPLGPAGPGLLPGNGNPMVMAQVDGNQLLTSRDLTFEVELMDQLKRHCPPFNYISHHVLQLDELEDALACLEILQSLEAPKIQLQWPKGKAVKLSAAIDSSKVSVALNSKQQWFGIEGQLQLDENEVIDFKDLLAMFETAHGRFIPLGKDKFLTLTGQLKQQLDDIAALSVQGQFHGALAPAMEQAVEGMNLKATEQWQQSLQRLKAANELAVTLPDTLQAELRDYQKVGYDWAYRLAYWGFGACLADDMGLGKTMQILALLLSRAQQGPALVLAPVSVCFNWQMEANRFAPTLKVKMLSEGSIRQRRKWLKDTEAFDLVVCSYGILQTEFDLINQTQWHTLVADEAQALKNPNAKRTQLATKLHGDFKLAATGTPIENNLSELWSLFNFINPGLLGTLAQFNQKFAQPIESSGEADSGKAAGAALRKLISPFILRRLKSEVLTELPPRTEINLTVEQSPEEQAFYEALRRQALEQMLKSSDKKGQQRLQILAELMRLRRACCHPSLVNDEVDIDSSKLKVFDGLVDELRQGHHKALVFSQFVGHLTLLREHLQQKGVSYQYLDGSTSAAQRKKAVNAFQAGEGDLFLISLKAGGSGLNLTAADYVIHMDPWWNPAVEDQASDRAYRMGQTRPVTIYRLITQNTIEDKILQLHQQKRLLADSLLEGSDISGGMSYEDLLALLEP